MAIASINPSSNAAQLQTKPAEKQDAGKAAEDAAKAAQARVQQEEQAQRARTAQQPQQKQTPVVNTQGQTTGRVVNTTA